MSVFFRPRAEQRAISFQDFWGTGGDSTLWQQGEFSLVPLFAAHRFIVDQFSSTPLHAYRETPDGLQKLSPQPSLFTEPMPRTPPVTWKAKAISSLLAYGNAYGYEHATASNGWAASVDWLNPAKVDVDETDPTAPVYYWNGRRLDSQRVIHIPWVVPGGKVRGLSPMGLFKATFEMGWNAQAMARDWYRNGSIPSGHLKSSGTVSPEKAAETKARFKEFVANRDVLVTGADWDYKAISLPPDQLRFVETMRLNATQIASIYGIPPEKIGGERSASSLTYSTVLMDQLAVQVEVLQPWFTRVEEYLSLLCLPRPVVAKFNMDATLRADPESRAKVHATNLHSGVETNDEARRLENRPPLTPAERAQWLEAYHPAKSATTAPGQDGTGQGGTTS